MIASNGESANYVPPQYDDMQNLQGFGSGCSVVPQATINGETLVQSSLVNYTIISYPAQFKPFLCHVCNKGFSSKNSRDKHYRNLHLMERKECSICRKVFSNIYNLKRHVQGAHGAYMDQKTGVVHTQRNERLQQTPSPILSEENSSEGQGADSNIEFREWDETPTPGSPESGQSSTPCDSISPRSPSSPIKLGGANRQSYFEAFIPPRYHHVQDGNFNEYISDDDNLNFLEDGDDADAVLEGLSVKTPSPAASVKACSSTRQRSQSPLRFSPDIGTQSCFFAHLGLVRSKTSVKTTATATATATNNNIDSFVNKEIPNCKNRLTQEEILSLEDKETRLLAERKEIFLEVEAFKNSSEGRAERAKIKRKGKAEKERIRRLWGKASRKSNRVARKKGRESPQDLQPSPSAQSTSGGKATEVNSDQAVVSQKTVPVALTRNVRVTRQRSKTK